ncbi:MAG: S8 family serine peptidase, partial [candidate division Zixibacteria bacterium]|nr:S8 family serine peptidase [candidate division Zixibacteria bacterium]
ARAAQINQLQNSFRSQVSEADFQIRFQYQTIPCFSGRLTSAGLEKISRMPEVAAIEPDRKVFALLAQSVPLVGADWAQDSGYTGDSVVVAVLDTGIDSLHTDFTGAIVAQRHYLLGGTIDADSGDGAVDGHGHGTMVSGIVASRGNVSSVGVAPDARIVAVKVLDDAGSGFFSDVARGLDWCAATVDSLGVDVVNMSLGGGLFSSECDGSFPSLKAAVDACRAENIIVYAASGNDGKFTQLSAPACITGCFSVGAVYDTVLGREPDFGTYQSVFGNLPNCFDSVSSPQVVTCFSNRSYFMDLLGPGRRITTSYPGNFTSEGTGTSFASPHAAGVTALLRQKDSTLTPDSALSLLQATGNIVYDPPSGRTFRRINVRSALQEIPNCGMPGDANADSIVTLSDVIGTVNFVFNKPGWPTNKCYTNSIRCWLSDLLCRGDWNGSGSVALSDVIQGVNHLFNKPGGPWDPVTTDLCCQPAP